MGTDILKAHAVAEMLDVSQEARQGLRHRSSLATIAASASSPEVIGPFDFFISHASEDKAEVVRALASELMQLGARVFYDEATLKVGDSLRPSLKRHG